MAGRSAIRFFDEIFHPVSRRLVAKCDAVLRIGGASAGADEMVALGREHGKIITSRSLTSQRPETAPRHQLSAFVLHARR